MARVLPGGGAVLGLRGRLAVGQSSRPVFSLFSVRCDAKAAHVASPEAVVCTKTTRRWLVAA